MREKHPTLFWIWNVFALVAAAACLGLVSLWFATGAYGRAMFVSYLKNPWILLMNLAPVVVLCLALWAAVKRTWLAFLLTAGVVSAATVASYFKLTFRNDPMLFEDILLIREAGNMAGKYQLFLNKSMVLALLCILFGTLFLFFLCRAKPAGWTRLTLLATALLMAVGVQQLVLDPAVYSEKTANFDLVSRWNTTDVYLSKGFVYPFLYSTTQVGDPAPEGYSAAQAEDRLAAFPDADIPEGKKVNVVAIMLEAFQDFSRFGTPALVRDVYGPYHQLEAESYTGDLVVNIFAGGTVDTERCFLTGYSQLPSFRTRVNAYPWYFRSQGYQTTGMHPCYQWFYNRQNVNEYLGFQDYRFMENFFGDYYEYGPAPDDIFFPLLMEDLTERQKSEAPIFSFSVTYQGHGPYDATAVPYGTPYDYISADAGFTPAAANILGNYFISVDNTVRHLVELRDFLAAQDEPYVLVLFGDHNPWMGDGNTVYYEMGLNLNLGTQEGIANYYSTRYLIWANDAAKEVTGSDFQGEGPAIGPYYLMNHLFELCGWEGPGYMQASRQTEARLPVVHSTGFYQENGEFVLTLSPEGEAVRHDFAQTQYYYRRHFLYDDVA